MKYFLVTWIDGTQVVETTTTGSLDIGRMLDRNNRSVWELKTSPRLMTEAEVAAMLEENKIEQNF